MMNIYNLTQKKVNNTLTSIKKEPTISFENLVNNQATKVYNTTKNASFASLGPSAPDSVKSAWIKASIEVNVNGFGNNSQGQFNHISAMLTLQNKQIYKDNDSDFLGNSVNSAISATKKALDLLNNPSNARFHTNDIDETKERAFYEAFLKYLKAIK